MRRSLQWRLSLILGSAILLAALVAAAISFLVAYHEATEFQDDMLRQIASLAARDSGGAPRIGAPDQLLGEEVLDNAEAYIHVIRLPEDIRPDWLAEDLQAGFHTLTPLLLLPLLMVFMILRIVRRELAPVKSLAAHLDAQPADRPRALSDTDVPSEIRPFVLAINRLLERVGILMEQQRRFVADAAHELRSPLTALSVQAQNLREATTLEVMRERIEPLQAGIERAHELTEQLLTLARFQAVAELTTDVDVAELARELIADYLPLAEAKGIDLGLDEITPVRIRAARDSLRLVLRNGLDNALKYTPPGGEVTLRLASDTDGAVIDILDNGPGIPAAERERVFDAFYRPLGTSGEGSGLGLPIAREAAASLGGSLSLLDRAQGPGLRFRYCQGDK